MKTLDYLIQQNSLSHLLIAVAAAVLTFLLLLFGRDLAVRYLRRLSIRTVVIWDDVLTEVIASTKRPFLAWVAVLAGVTQIDLPDRIEPWPLKAMMVLLILQIGIWASRAVRTWLNFKLEHSQTNGDGAAATNYGIIAFISKLVIWIVVVLLMLDNLGINITALVASLGIGGVAVALALQNVLGDLFASLSIALDKPFVVGDFIIIDDLMGTVRHVGLKTTRIRSLGGEELVFSNADLLKSRVRNYKRMAERRVVFSYGVTYDTPPERLEALVGKTREIIEAIEGVRFDRAHFKGFGASSLDIEVVYFMLSPDYNLYMDTQQAINLALLRYCNEQGLSFAFPTQTVHVASLPAGVRGAAASASTAPAAG